jgi:hypothetical protein
MPLLEDSRNNYQEAGHGQSRCNKFEVAKEIFNLTMSHIAEGGPFDDLYDGFANGRCECSCDDDKSGKVLESRCALKIGAAPLGPKVHNDCEHCARVEHNQKQCHRRRRRIQTQQLLRYDYMRRARHWQEFGQSLHYRKNDDF